MIVLGRSIALCLAVACAASGADERRPGLQADIESVLALRSELHDAVRLVAERHAELASVAAAVRQGVHPGGLEIAELRTSLAALAGDLRAAHAQSVERLRAAEAGQAAWRASVRDALEALEAEQAAIREAYLIAKSEHDELAAELAETVVEFNAAADAFNTGDPEAGDREAEAERLRAMEARIAEGRVELAGRREPALERYVALSNAEQASRAERERVAAERRRRRGALSDARARHAAERAREEEALTRESAAARERITAIETGMRRELASLDAARDEALAALERGFGTDHEALAEAIDAWLADGASAVLYVAPGEPRFDRGAPRVDALYAAIERIEAPAPARPLRVIEEE